jgi:RHS repeat-associated protein
LYSCGVKYINYLIGSDGLRNYLDVPPNPSLVSYYTATVRFPITTQSGTANWTLTGGTIVSYDNSSLFITGQATAAVQWDGHDPVKSITFYMRDNNGMIQTGTLNVTYSASNCYTYPAQQTYLLGQAACLIKAKQVCVGTKNPPPQVYQWQETDYEVISWSDIPGATAQDYQPPAMLGQGKLFRRKTTGGTQVVYSDVASVLAAPFTAGELSTISAATILYGQTPVIYAKYAFGGICEPYAIQNYLWEQSVNKGPWEVIGTTSYYPPDAPGIKGSTRIRRRTIICTGAIEYTNTLTFNVLYTSPNHENRNYVRENTVLIKGVRSWEHADDLATGDKVQSTQYLDGSGRPIQNVTKEGSFSAATNEWKDLVTPHEYDEAGRIIKNYLPYPSATNPGKFKTTAIAEQNAFYNNNFQNNGFGYSQVEYDNSPENKVIKVFKPGQAWVGSARSTNTNFDLNLQTEDVQNWTITYTAGAIPASLGAFPDNALFRTIVSDEHNKQELEYRDKFGRLILKKVQLDDVPSINHSGWLCTYYVYDDFSRLRFVIPPKAVKYLELNGWGSLASISSELCYSYEHDDKGRLIVKKFPGQSEEHVVYDNRDRVVFTQDENQRAGHYTNGTKQWSFTLYDELNNVVATGIADNSYTRSQLQFDVNNLGNGNVSLPIVTNKNEVIKTYNPVIGAGYCAGCTNIAINSVKYYGVYDKSPNMLDDFDNSYSLAYPLDDLSNSYDNRLTNVLTGKKVKVLDGSSNNYLSTTFYYNRRGQLLQTINWTLKGKQMITNQYEFSGTLISVNNKLTDNGVIYSITDKIEYDKLRRLQSFSKKVNNAADYKKLSENVYDEFGRVKTKRIGINPLSGGAELEQLDYSYTIQGNLEGINKNYALKLSGYNKWQRFFGSYFGYDNADSRFAKAEYSGQMSGVIWNTQGDDEQRKYDFYYDNAGQFKDGIFKQYDAGASSWVNTKVDFTSNVQYDLNGNIKSVLNKGIVPAKAPQVVDDLQYSYRNNDWSNLLHAVEEGLNNTLASLNGKIGEFKDDAAPGVGTGDYDYDPNGNLVLDENKAIKNLYNGKGIKYNHLNLVAEVKVDGQATEKYIYNAAGEKLQKIFTPAVGGATTTTYAHPFIFENNNLSLILTEEGRMRVITPYNTNNGLNLLQGNFQLPNGKWGVYDYFIKDHLQNTRVVVTEELQSGADVCTMEKSNPAEELRQATQFGQIDPVTLTPNSNNEVRRSWIGNTSSIGWTTNPTADLCKLEKNGQRIGPNIILKVMAGDIIRAESRYYYAANPGPGTSSIINDILNALLGAYATAGGGGLKAAVADLNTSLPPSLMTFVTQQQATGSPNAPQAYLNYIFFDEQMNPVQGASNSDRVSQPGDAYNHWVQFTDLKAPKNGYVYVFLSNESVQPVYFDDFAVTHVRGRIAEENHYYPYGLKMAGISSRKLGDANNGTLQNKYGYQGLFSEENGFTGWNEFKLRNYDPQVGRWTSADPITQYASPYIGMGNNPIVGIDPNGGFATRLGAWLWNLVHGWGGGDIVYNGKQWTVNFPILNGIETVFRNPSAGSRSRRARAEQFSEYMKVQRFRYEVAHNIGRGPYSGPIPHMGPDGNAIWGGEKGLETPAIDPIDLGSGLIKGIVSAGARKVAASEVAEAIEVTTTKAATSGLANAAADASTKALVKMDDVLLSQGTFAEITNGVEVIGHYSLHGVTKGMVGTTFNRNILYITIPKEHKSIKALKELLATFEKEALSNGANKLSIYGSSVINDGILNAQVASRLGYTVQPTRSGVLLEKVLR